MQFNSVLKIVIVLLIIMILSIAGALFFVNRNKNRENPADTDPAVTTNASSDTTGASEDTGASSDTKTSSDTTSAVTESETTTVVTEPVTTTAADPVVDPPVVDPEKPAAPKGFSLTKEFVSDSGTNINTRAVCTAVEDNGRVRLTVDLYLEYRSLYISARKEKYCVLTVGDQTVNFTTDEINEPSNAVHSLHLCSHTQYLPYGETVNVNAKFRAGVVYGGVNVAWLEIDEKITLK